LNDLINELDSVFGFLLSILFEACCHCHLQMAKLEAF